VALRDGCTNIARKPPQAFYTRVHALP
jgi:hypothetical protein